MQLTTERTSKMKKIMVAFGTRPEAIKLAPLIFALKREKRFSCFVCHSGQHRSLCDDVLNFFGISEDVNLKICDKGSSVSDMTANALSGYTEAIKSLECDAVIVHGDTTTAFACALSAFYLKVPIIHIEAGLRSFDLSSPFPEEWNRIAIDTLCDYCFAPTKSAKENLIDMGKREKSVFCVGNTVTDALRYTVREGYSHAFLRTGKKLILFTCHRRESVGQAMVDMCRALIRVTEEFPDTYALCPMHPNPLVRSIIVPLLSGRENIILSEPLPLFDFHNLLSRSHLVMSDSGGVQEEASTLGIPMLIMRDKTERTEGCEKGIIRLVGTDTDTLYEQAKKILGDEKEYEKMKKSAYSYGDGKVSARICDILKNTL